MASLDDLQSFVDGSEPWFREKLKLLVEQKTISPGSSDPAPIVAGARVALDLMKACGAEAHLVECGGTPSIIGEFRHPNPKARIVIYNHFDVQPADASVWDQDDPFAFSVEPHPEREFLYRGRGATDDKGPAMCALRAAQYVQEHDIPVDVVLLWETEEEIGSPNFEEVVSKSKDVLNCDGVIVSDTIWPSDKVPAISWGLRGSLNVQLRLRTGDKQVHSGLTGGVARNPVKELARLATEIDSAQFWRDGVVPPSDEEVQGYARSGFDPEYFKRAHSLHSLTTDIPLEMLIRLWASPTFEIHGIVGGYTGPGVKTSVPHEAELKASFRMVPDQDAHKIASDLRAFCALANKDVDVEIAGYLGPFRGTLEGRVHDAMVKGMTDAFGQAPVPVREGGSIGEVPILVDQLGTTVHFLPLSLPEHGYHAPNEYFDWKQARFGIEAYIRTFDALAND
jgi:acetylornithine deacetylase/succinyl-diaminopimelate desuccinylase-like protein